MQQQLVGDILSRRRDRAIAIVLGVKEREADRHLPPEAQRKLRKVVLDQFNDLTDLARDLLQSYADSVPVVMNEVYLERLDQIYDLLVEQQDDD